MPDGGDGWIAGLVLAVRCVYVAVLLLSSPLIFLPGAKITEHWLFGGGPQPVWRVNALRAAEFGAMALVAILFKDTFQAFVGIVGVVTGAPIAFIYPAVFHLRTVQPRGVARFADHAWGVFGGAAVGFVGWQTALGG